MHPLIRLAIALLDNPHGIDTKAWEILKPMLIDIDDCGLLNQVRCKLSVKNYASLPADWRERNAEENVRNQAE